jgi:hypothetical protein
VALTQIDIDEDVLAEAMRLSGAKTKKDTLNLAPKQCRKCQAWPRSASLACTGAGPGSWCGGLRRAAAPADTPG